MESTIENLERRWLLSSGFPAQQTFAAGATPDAITVADVNGDGRPDLIVGNNHLNGYVSVFLGNGNGTFRPSQTLALYGVPRSVVVADVNGDGKGDLIVSNSLSNDISVFLGNGNGTFGLPKTFAAGQDPFSLAVADVNGDGRLDLIAADDTASGYVSVLIGNGNGTFHAAETFAAGADPRSLAAVDVNGDGTTDLIVAADVAAGRVSVLLGNGNGTFQARQTIAAGQYPFALAVADVNGDGRPDLVVPNVDGSKIGVFLGNGNGTFQARLTFAVGQSPIAVALGDVNGDGRADVIVTNSPEGGGYADVLLGNGNGTFQARQSAATGLNPYAVAVADLNGDERPDLMVANSDSNDVSVLLNSYAGTPTITQVGGLVTGTGTTFPDTAKVVVSGSNIVVTIDGMSDSIPTSSITGILISTGAGNDSVRIADGVPAATVEGAGGNDSIVTRNAGDSLRGGGNNDVILIGGDAAASPGIAFSDDASVGTSDTAVGGGGNDTLISNGVAGEGLYGGPGDDLFVNADGSGDSIDGGVGLNFAQANSGDTLSNIVETYDPNPADPQPDYDTVPDSAGGDDLQIFGTTGNDSITLSDDGMGNLVVVENGGAPQDIPEAGITAILLAGGLGDDTLVAESSVILPVSLRGAMGNDSLVGGGGPNVLVGGSGNDTLQGGEGTNDLVPGRRVTFVDTPTGNDVLIGGPAGSQNFADFAYRTDNLYLINNGLPDSGDTAAGEATTIMPSVQNIFAGTGLDTAISVVAGSFLSAGVGEDSLSSGGVNTSLVAGPPGAGEDTVVANGAANALYLQNGHADEYQGEIIGDILQTDSSDVVL